MANFWKNKRVLITGASGFVGKHLTKRLAALKASVDYFNENVSDSNKVNSVFNSGKYHFCYHLAAQSLLNIAGKDPIPTFDTNIRGTWNVLEAARQNKLEGIIIASTTHVYGKNRLPFLETYYPRPTGPYETSKACADILAQTYANYYALPVAIARCVNIYGPGDQNNRIIPKTINFLLKNQHPEIFSNETTRDYMYIDDATDAYITLGENLKNLMKILSNITFNFGTGKHYSNAYIVNRIIKLSATSSVKPIFLENNRKLEISKQYVSIQKAKEFLNWKPHYSLDEGLKKTIKWYQEEKTL